MPLSLSGTEDGGVENGEEDYRPSVALKYGHTLTKLLCKAIRMYDTQKEDEAIRFDRLKTAEWAEKVSCTAHAVLADRKLDKLEETTDSDDLHKFSVFLKEEIEVAIEQLEREPSQKAYRRLEELILSRLRAFNKIDVSEKWSN